MRTILRRAVPALMVIAAAGCGSTGGLGEILGGVLNAPASNGTGSVAGEITSVDTNNRQIQVRTSDNQTGWIGYDANTKVYYGQQEYTVSALERGDMVSMTVQQVNQNQLYTNSITVTQSVQDRTGTGTSTSSNLQRLEGTVGYIDRNRGTFELKSGNATFAVSIAYNATSTVRDRYSRMRTGDYVRLEGTWLSQNQLQVERFVN